MHIKVAELVNRFKTEAHKAGSVIYEADSASDACNYILKLARERDVKNAVKSQSQIAEAINLREGLQKAGIVVTETDMKQWLAQLACGKPTRGKATRQMAKLISKAIGQKLDPEPQTLLNAANRVIRQYCIDADLGISEADMAIAETGTVIIAGNEGVTRLVAVLPRIHVTLLEVQNVVPVMEDVFVGLETKPRDVTAQIVPAYVTYITGRNTTADIPGAVLARAQGPAEEHIILLDKVAKRGTP
jgi:L-lactate dehydrogenase complex protein LldF